MPCSSKFSSENPSNKPRGGVAAGPPVGVAAGPPGGVVQRPAPRVAVANAVDKQAAGGNAQAAGVKD
jgi:hypothetical protein